MDWQALPLIVELMGIEDVQLLVDELMAIRSHVERLEAANRG